MAFLCVVAGKGADLSHGPDWYWVDHSGLLRKFNLNTIVGNKSSVLGNISHTWPHASKKVERPDITEWSRGEPITESYYGETKQGLYLVTNIGRYLIPKGRSFPEMGLFTPNSPHHPCTKVRTMSEKDLESIKELGVYYEGK